MKREIKFRAWDEDANYMVYMGNEDDSDEYIWSIEADEIICYRIDEDAGTIDEPPSPKAIELENDIMQYTGLKDKNGKEIYEGDKIKTFDNEIGEVRYERSFCVYGIQNEKHFRSFENIFSSFIDNNSLVLYSVMSEHIEVIGNVHENPELL